MIAGGEAGAADVEAATSEALAKEVSMSPFVTRPALPVPATVAGSRPVSPARRRTAGEGKFSILESRFSMGDFDSLALVATGVDEADC